MLPENQANKWESSRATTYLPINLNTNTTKHTWINAVTFSKKMGMFSLTTVYRCSQYVRNVKEHTL